MKFSKFLVIFLFLIVMYGCVKDNVNVCPSRGLKISLLLDDMSDYETRSVASGNERWITDAYLLVFGSDKKYKFGERVDVAANVVDNGLQEPALTTKLLIDNGDNIVVLCNTGVSSLPSFVVGTSTTADINGKFASSGWNINQTGTNSGKGMPMSGVVVWNYSTRPKVQMYRSIAKVQLLLAIDEDITGTFTTESDSVKWGMYNVVADGNIYSVGDAMSLPAVVTFNNVSSLPQRVVGASGATAEQVTYYMPEYPNATYAKTVPVPSSTFSVERTCLIVQTSAGYYRIDLASGNAHSETKAFLDLKRNSHYKVSITKVKSAGYSSVEEALANPASNLEYEIQITGDMDNYLNSNGQYAVSVEEEAIKFFDDKDYALRFSLITHVPIELQTAYVDIVKNDKSTSVKMPKCLSINGVTPVNDMISLGNQNSSAEFILKCNALTRDIDTLKTLKDCYFRIRFGNITKYVLIEGITTGSKNNIVLYYGSENCIEIAAGSAVTKTINVTPYSTIDELYGPQNHIDKDMCEPLSADMLWSDVSCDHLSNVQLNHSEPDLYTVTFDCNGKAGNAVIAIYNTTSPVAPDARILWSYHIWVSDRSEDDDQSWSVINTTDRTIVYNKYMMMDRNLGATSDSIATNKSNSAYGLIYQWGRKDPFVGAKSYNSSSVRKTQYSPSGTFVPSWITTSDAVGTIAYSVEHPSTFIARKDNTEDWLGKRDNSLWGNPTTSNTWNYYPHSVGQKSVFDPCPKGYCVPPQDAYTMTVNANYTSDGRGISAGSGALRNASGGTGGCQFYYENFGFGATAYLPLTGSLHRLNSNLDKVGNEGLYWTNTNLTILNANAASRAGFNNATWNPIWGAGRAMGQSVRCMRIIR